MHFYCISQSKKLVQEAGARNCNNVMDHKAKARSWSKIWSKKQEKKARARDRSKELKQEAGERSWSKGQEQ